MFDYIVRYLKRAILSLGERKSRFALIGKNRQLKLRIWVGTNGELRGNNSFLACVPWWPLHLLELVFLDRAKHFLCVSTWKRDWERGSSPKPLKFRRNSESWDKVWFLAMGCRKKCSNYCVNDGTKLALIILWVLATAAVFTERYVGMLVKRAICRFLGDAERSAD